MTTETHPRLSLSDVAKPLIWRIFGAAADPQSDKSAFELAVPILSSRLPDSSAASAITEVRSWFKKDADPPWIRPELMEPIANVIDQGLDPDFPELAVWAIGAIDAEVAAPILRTWPEPRTVAFAEASVATLSAFQKRGHVVDPTRASGISGLNRRRTTVPRDAIERNSPLATFLHLESHGWELVHYALHPSAGNLIDILVDMLSEIRPACLPSLITRLEHPVLQARAADRFSIPARRADVPHAPLSWITPTADDSVIALSTIHTLHAVNDLTDNPAGTNSDHARRQAPTDQLPADGDQPQDAAESLIQALVDHGTALPLERFAHWAADILVHAPQILHRSPDGSCPLIVRQLEKRCADGLAHVLTAVDPSKFLAPFRANLPSTNRHAMFRHLADVAWALRTSPNGQGVTVARLALEDYRKDADRELVEESFYFTWNNWQDRQSVRSLGRALALSNPTFDPAAWIFAECQRLPLTVWDGEDRIGAFFAADRIAQFNFLIAIHALEPATVLGRQPTPESVRQLAEQVWAHCRLADRLDCSDADITPAAEGAVRTAIRLGDPNEAWILNQAAAYPGPRALLALAQDLGFGSPAMTPQSEDNNSFAAEFAAVCVALFSRRPIPRLDVLVYWGELWLVLGEAEPAERTAAAIINASDRLGTSGRPIKILTLKLLALAKSQLSVGPDIAHEIVERYDDLWKVHTPTHEQADREQVDSYRKLVAHKGH